MHIVIFTGLLCLSAGVQEPVAPAGPAAYFKLDETSGTIAADSAGVGNGVYVGAPVPSATVNSPPITYPDLASLSFNGTSQAVNVPNFGTFTSFSIATWVNRSGPTAARQSIASYKENANNGFVLCLNDNGSSEFPRIWVNVTPGGWLFKEAATVVGQGVWTHLAASYDGAFIRLYIDGIEQLPATAAAGAMTNAGADTFGIGGRNSYNQHWFPGLIDDVRVYNRDLTATEVAVLAAGCPTPTALIATAGLNQVQLGWGAPTGPAATYTYNVKRRPSGVGNYTSIGIVSGLTYTDNVAGGTAYDYVITALSAAESGPSASATATPTLPPPRTQKLGGDGNGCGCSTVPVPGLPILSALLAAAGLLLLPWSRRARG